jgi:hypothetical protein
MIVIIILMIGQEGKKMMMMKMKKKMMKMKMKREELRQISLYMYLHLDRFRTIGKKGQSSFPLKLLTPASSYQDIDSTSHLLELSNTLDNKPLCSPHINDSSNQSIMAAACIFCKIIKGNKKAHMQTEKN